MSATIKYKLQLTDVKITVEECDAFSQLVQVKVWFDVCYLYVDLRRHITHKCCIEIAPPSCYTLCVIETFKILTAKYNIRATPTMLGASSSVIRGHWPRATI